MRITYSYNTIENAYLSRIEIERQEKYAKAVADLYTKILEFQAKLARYFGTSTLKNLGKNIVQINVSWKDESEDLAKMDREAQETLAFLNYDTQQSDLMTIRDHLTNTKAKLDAVLQQFFAQRDRSITILKWLSPISYRRDHISTRRALGDYSTNSCKWFLQHKTYQDWTASSDGLLWLRDHIGTGKSTIASMVIESFMRQPKSKLAFFYCSANVTKSSNLGNIRDIPHNTSENIIRSILRQLSVSADGTDVAQSVCDIYNPDIDCELSMRDCTNLILEIIETTGNVTLVVDALDECADRDGLLNTLGLLRMSSKVRIFLTSRRGISNPKSLLGVAEEMTMKTQNSNDIEQYISREIDERREGCALTDNQAKSLREILNSNAQGM